MPYDRPKILTVDTPTDVGDRLEENNFSVSRGTFGSPYKTDQSSGFGQVYGAHNLPNYHEQDIIVIDQEYKVLRSPEGHPDKPKSESDVWCKKDKGFIDPRPKYMVLASSKLSKILNNGGVFIVFADAVTGMKYIRGHKSSYGSLQKLADFDADVWSFLDITRKHIETVYECGKEVKLLDQSNGLHDILARYEGSFFYNCIFKPSSYFRRSSRYVWIPLAINKYDDKVGGVIVERENKGIILLLPQSGKKKDIVEEIAVDHLPEVKPHLFPYLEKDKWKKEPIYEMKEISCIEDKKERIRQAVKKKLSELDKKLENKREKYDFMYNVLTCDGDKLVKSVIQCLELVGFENIIDVDEDRDYDQKQEDIQILDKTTRLVVEVKGLSGMPNEKAVSQAVKYIPRRMKEWGKFDINGVLVVNHQKNIPPLERNNNSPFTEQQIQDAKNNNVMLMTTWQIHKIAKGVKRWGWHPDEVKYWFYQNGWTKFIPKHYELVGEMFNVFQEPEAYALEVEEYGIQVGDRVGYVLDTGIVEEEIQSLEVENSSVESANIGQSVGVKTNYINEISDSLKVYLVKRSRSN